MEEYIQTPSKPECFSLSRFDMLGSPNNISFAYFYENVGLDHDFLPTNLLKQSLAKTLEHFPILLGHLRRKIACFINIVVDPAELNFPNFQESIEEVVGFSELRKANFNWSAWPENVPNVGGFAKPAPDGEIRLLNVHVVRLKNNSGLILFVSCPHYVFDASGYFCFVKEWARVTNAMASGQPVQPSANLRHDRSYIYSNLPKDRQPLDKMSNVIYSTANEFCDSLTLLSPTELGNYLSTFVNSGPPARACLFHFTKAVLDNLQDEVSKYLPDEIRISRNSLILAIVSKVYIQTQFAALSKQESTQASSTKDDFFTIMPCDVREQLGLDGYTGNLLMRLLIRDSAVDLASDIIPETIAQSVSKIQSTLRTLTPALVSEFHNVVSQHPTSYLRGITFAGLYKDTSMLTSSVVKFKPYDANFGTGKPQFVSPPPAFEGSYTATAILPPPEGVDGLYVWMTSSAGTMAKFLEHPFWRQTAETVW